MGECKFIHCEKVRSTYKKISDLLKKDDIVMEKEVKKWINPEEDQAENQTKYNGYSEEKLTIVRMNLLRRYPKRMSKFEKFSIKKILEKKVKKLE